MPLLNTHPFGYAASVTTGSAYRSSFVQEFGQGLTDTNLADAEDQAYQAKIRPTDVDQLIRALSGMSQSTAVAAPDSPDRDSGINFFSYLMKFPRAMMLTRAFAPNTFEPLGNIQAFGGGPVRFLKAMKTLASRDYGALQESFAREGLVQTWVMHATIDKQRPLHQSAPRIFREYLLRLFPTIQAWKLQEMQAAAMGVAMADAVRTGSHSGLLKESDRSVLKDILRFTEEETEKLMSGKAPDAMYVEIARRFTTRSNTTMLSLPAEESKLASDDVFNEWIPFHRYSQMKVRSFQNAHSGLIDTSKAFLADKSKANLTKLAGSMRTIALYHTGTAASGSMTYLFLALMAGGPAGLKVALRDLEDDPKKFIATSWMSAQFGPLMTLLTRVWTDKRIDNLWMVSAPLSVAYETASALGGLGKYQFMSPPERAVAVLNRVTPGPRAVVDVMVAMGLTDTDPVRDLAVSRYWKWVREEAPPSSRTEWTGADAEYRMFRGNMARAYKQMEKKQTAETIAKANEYIELAIEGGGRDRGSAASSIRSRRLLPHVKKEQMEDFKKYMGADLFAALETHDAMLNEWASKFSGGGRNRSGRGSRSGRSMIEGRR